MQKYLPYVNHTLLNINTLHLYVYELHEYVNILFRYKYYFEYNALFFLYV